MTTKSKTFVIMVAVMLFAVALTVLIIYPTYSDIRGSSEELLSQKQKISALEKKIENIEEFRQNYKSIGESIEKANLAFATSDAPVNFITFLEQIALNSNVSMEISPSIPIEELGSEWKYIDFQINSLSSFPNFLKFLEKLESGPYLIEINSLKVSRISEKMIENKAFEQFSAGDAKFVISLKVYSN